MATMNIKMSDTQLETLVTRAVQRAFEIEQMKFNASNIPYISKREQKEFEKKYKKPSRDIAKTTYVNL